QGILSGAVIRFWGQKQLTLLLSLLLLLGIVLFLMTQSLTVFTCLTALAFLIAFLLIIPIGGADMPVVISMLNSYSGWAAAGIGFTLGHTALIITGALG